MGVNKAEHIQIREAEEQDFITKCEKKAIINSLYRDRIEKLAKEFPNNMDLGNKVRELVNEMKNL